MQLQVHQLGRGLTKCCNAVQVYELSSMHFLPKEWIMEQWDRGFYISSVAGRLHILEPLDNISMICKACEMGWAALPDEHHMVVLKGLSKRSNLHTQQWDLSFYISFVEGELLGLESFE